MTDRILSSADKIDRELAKFDSEYERRVGLAATLQQSLTDDLTAEGFRNFRVSARAKSRDRFEAKLRKDPWRRDPFDPIEDALGVRVATAFESDIPWLEQFFRNLWVVDDSSWVDKTNTLRASEFGYRSVQFVAQIPDPSESPSFRRVLRSGRQKIEVQLRTSLSDVWSEVEHARYEHPERRTRDTDRLWALTAALIEQADTNLSQIRELSDGVLAAAPDQTRDLPASIQRFIQYHADSKDLDEQLTRALDLPMRRVERSETEVVRTASDAGWTTWDELEQGLSEFGTLAIRFAIVVAPTSRGLVRSDIAHDSAAGVFRGAGLYFAALAASLLNGGTVPFRQASEHPRARVHSVPDGRLAEYLTVVKHLNSHRRESALDVRAKYQSVAAPMGSLGHADGLRTILLD